MPFANTPLQLLIQKLERRTRLTTEDQAALLKLDYRRRLFRANEYIVRENERPGPCQLLIDGIAMRTKMTLDGSRQIMSLQFPGDMMDLQHLYLDHADHNLEALTLCRVAEVERTAVQHLMKTRPSLMRAIIIEIASEASIHREWALNIGCRSGRARIAHLICEFAYRIGSRDPSPDDEFILPMTQDQLGDAVAITSIHVNRKLKELTELKLILRPGRFKLKILDWIGLQNEAGFNPRYLHMPRQEGSL
jgi:CRP-like cAMP-binding protein